MSLFYKSYVSLKSLSSSSKSSLDSKQTRNFKFQVLPRVARFLWRSWDHDRMREPPDVLCATSNVEKLEVIPSLWSSTNIFWIFYFSANTSWFLYPNDVKLGSQFAKYCYCLKGQNIILVHFNWCWWHPKRRSALVNAAHPWFTILVDQSGCFQSVLFSQTAIRTGAGEHSC